MHGRFSIWRRGADIPPRPQLTGDLRADVAVIGAGMAGVLIADRLRARGVRAVVLEAARMGGGQTQNTTAKITSQHGMIYDALIKTCGEAGARMYARANERAIDEYAALVRARGIDCDFCRAPAYLYSRAGEAPLRREAQAAARLGVAARFVADPGLPFETAGAVRFDGQARFHPLKFLRAVSEGLEIYEQTPVLAVEGERLRTARGVVRAGNVVFATHYPFVNVPGWYFMRMHQERSYVLALRSDWLPEGMYYGADNDGLSFRTAEGLLLVSGENHRTGENSRGGRYDALLARAQSLLPGCREAARWSAQDCITLDGVPYIGPFSHAAPGWYVATGFGKWGMSTAMAAAMIIAGQITGETPGFAPVFTPERFRLSSSARSLATETAQAFKGLARETLELPRAALDALPAGHGGIVAVEGRKVGVYKDGEGACHLVRPRCPHLGCQLAWNPDELSWDCPCHGSRFGFDGALIDNPAQEGLTQ